MTIALRARLVACSSRHSGAGCLCRAAAGQRVARFSLHNRQRLVEIRVVAVHTVRVSSSEDRSWPGVTFVHTVIGGLLVVVLGAVALAFIPQAGSLSPFADDVADPEASVSLDTVIDQGSFADVDLRYRVTSPRELTGPLRLFVDLQTPVRDKGPLTDSSIDSEPAVHASVKAGEQVLAEAQTPLPLPTPVADIRLNLGASTWEPASGDPTELTEGRRLEDSLQRYGLVIGSAGPDSVTEGLVTLRLAKDAEPPLKVNTN